MEVDLHSTVARRRQSEPDECRWFDENQLLLIVVGYVADQLLLLLLRMRLLITRAADKLCTTQIGRVDAFTPEPPGFIAARLTKEVHVFVPIVGQLKVDQCTVTLPRIFDQIDDSSGHVLEETDRKGLQTVATQIKPQQSAVHWPKCGRRDALNATILHDNVFNRCHANEGRVRNGCFEISSEYQIFHFAEFSVEAEVGHWQNVMHVEHFDGQLL